jgi:hypothetical protein
LPVPRASEGLTDGSAPTASMPSVGRSMKLGTC